MTVPQQQTVPALNKQFAIPGLRFLEGRGGLVLAEIDTLACLGEIYLHGAHITSWQPAGHQPVLWMSQKSLFEPKKPIRGGVPICFPWFGAHPMEAAAPTHGLARTHAWSVVAAGRLEDGGVGIGLRAAIGRYRVDYEVRFGRTLEMVFTVERRADATPVRFEAALHTYFSVGDVRQIRIEGLEKAGYIDKVEGMQRKGPAGKPIEITGETDQVYLGTKSDCCLIDPGMKRRITVHKAGSGTTVVWNPWIEKSARMADFGNDEWPGMVCIETANAADQAVDLAPGDVSCMRACLEVQPL